ncbi:hypothetical protein NQ314_000531 [Rhamnusium bicolor]|uniref:Laminin G domain-containing protein n=1 Tax=Rhamnusium bicolor TaxID=1586634 RepID=A0AAV8ZU07_9CUCU|nr:hypothetical protein NQ314_000531 [Rhamnusium bicolor]
MKMNNRNVPSFNGSSHLRYRGLAETALTWLDLDITFKPTAPDGLIIYNGNRMDGTNDFMGLYLNDGNIEFAYDLGTGPVVAKSQFRVAISEWHQVNFLYFNISGIISFFTFFFVNINYDNRYSHFVFYLFIDTAC